MTEPICRPLSKAKSEALKGGGLAITDFRGTRDSLFQEIDNPQAILATLRPVRGAYESWRSSMPLDPETQAYAMGWPVEYELDPGYRLGEAGGIPRWEVERAVEGLVAGEARSIELAGGLLLDADGCVMEMPGDVVALLIRSDALERSIAVREPVLLFGAINA